jgi:hypothetical protein
MRPCIRDGDIRTKARGPEIGQVRSEPAQRTWA